ncbi:MAG: D-alanyl-D-alanine endopeptidase (penicillin-binding protein 7) [Halioglobus sp.]|jgi:D-alanyl-D-alanine endopeptidase (penicillin-binding protein 7)
MTAAHNFFLFLIVLSLSTLTSAAAYSQSLKGNPGLHSASVLVTDSSGRVIYGKDVDTVRSIASITKLMTAMVIIDEKLDLDEKITITKDDRDLVRLTGSRLEYGAKLSRRELIQLALMSSENRAATALGRSFPGGMTAFLERMNSKATDLGMTDSHFADPAGLLGENVSTAKDLGKMVLAAGKYPLIGQSTTTVRKVVRPYAKRGPLNYGNTNRLLKNKNWDIALSKTGYINEAGRCLVMQAKIQGEEISIVLLNSFGKLTPFGDSNRLRKWMLASS